MDGMLDWAEKRERDVNGVSEKSGRTQTFRLEGKLIDCLCYEQHKHSTWDSVGLVPR